MSGNSSQTRQNESTGQDGVAIERTQTKSVEAFAEHYDRQVDEYDENHTLRTDEHAEYAGLVSLIVEYADPSPDETVIDLGAGTGVVTLELAEEAGTVIGRDISEEMLDRARTKAAERDVENVEFGFGRFRAPNVDDADVVVTTLAFHHLDDEAKREAITTVAALEPRRFVIGAAMFFDERHPEEPDYEPNLIYPATVGNMVDWLTGAGFVITDVVKLRDYGGIIVSDSSECVGE